MTAYPRPDGALAGSTAWRGAELTKSHEWIREWTRTELVELENALVTARAASASLRELRAADFPLPQLATSLEAIREELLSGRGFVLLRGLDPDNYSREELATIYWGIGTHLGRAVPQNARGDLLGHVKDLGRDANDPTARIYQTRERQGFHTDSADLVGLLCVEPAAEGGRSALVSCATVHNALLEAQPELLAALFEPFCTDHRGEHPPDAPPYFTAPIFSWHANELSVLYQRRYIESAQRFADVPRLTDRQVAALDALDAICEDPQLNLEMELVRGDIQFIHNHQLLHDRTSFRDAPEPARARHLLRLWLCPEDGRPLPEWFAERLRSIEPGDRGGVVLDGATPVVRLEPDS